VTIKRLVGVSKTTHTRHDTENVVVGSIDTNFSSLGAFNGGVGQDELKGSIVNAGEVATAAWLVLLRSKGKRVDIDTSVRGLGVVLVRLNKVEVSAFALREAILSVKLELSGYDRVHTPAVKVKRRLGKNESAGIRYSRVLEIRWFISVGGKVGLIIAETIANGNLTLLPPVSIRYINRTSFVEETRTIDEGASSLGNSAVTTEGMDSIGKSVDSIGVVKRLSTEKSVEELIAIKRRAIIDVLVRLDNPDKLFNGVVKVELDLVGRRTDRLITGELKLLNKILVGVLSHASALIGVQEDVVNIERGSNQRLVVGSVNTTAIGRIIHVAAERANSPQALINGTNIEIDLNLVILKSDEGKSETGITAIPELKGNIKSGLGESVTRGANLTRSVSLARTVNSVKRGVSDKSQLGGVADHSIITGLLFKRKSKVVPDVHPVTILAINALTTNLNLNLRDQLLTGKIEPTGINTVLTSSFHGLIDFRKSDLKVGAVSQITITRNGAGYTTTKIGLTVKSLLDRLHRKVSVTFVRHLPKGNLRVARKIDILGAVSYKLHKTSCHFCLL
jgi:hypothetical protein